MRWPFHYEHYSRVVWCVLNQKTYHLNHWALLYISGTIQCYKKHVMQYGLWPTASLWRQSWHGIIKNAYNTKTIRSLTAVYKNMFRFRNYCSNYPIMAHMTSIVHHLLSFEEQLIFFIVHVCRISRRRRRRVKVHRCRWQLRHELWCLWRYWGPIFCE